MSVPLLGESFNPRIGDPGKIFSRGSWAYPQLVESTTDLIYLLDQDCRFQFANNNYLSHIGLPLDKLTGKAYGELHSQEEEKALSKTVQEVIKNLAMIAEEHQSRRDGRYFLRTFSPFIIIEGDTEIIGVMVVSRDITALKNSEEALQESETKYRLLVENANEGIAVAQDGFLKFVNPMVAKISGYTQEELISMPFIDFFIPEDREKVLATFLNLVKGHPLSEAPTFRGIRKDGNTRWVEVRSVRITWDGKPAALNFITDITNRKDSEMALRRSKEKAQQLAKENDAIAEIGRIISSTLDIEEIYGKFAKEVSQLIPFDRLNVNLINPEDETITVRYCYGDKLAGRQKGDFFPLQGSIIQMMMSTKTGLILQPDSQKDFEDQFPIHIPAFQVGFLSLISLPLISENQVIGGLFFGSKKPNVYTDHHLRLGERIANQITRAIANAQLFLERKRAEEVLRRMEENYRSVFEHTGTAMLIVEEDMTISMVNTQLEILTGYSKEEIEGIKRGTDFIAQDDVEKIREFHRIRMVNPHAAPGNYECRCIDKAGGIRNVFLNVAVIPGTRKSVASVLDITDLRKSTEALKRSEENSRRLAEEKEAMAEIGRIIGSTLEIEKVYERFSGVVKNLIPFDWLAINIIVPEKDHFTMAYVAGLDIAGIRVGDVIPLCGTAAAEVIRTRSSLLIQEDNRDDFVKRMPALSLPLGIGKSMILVPLIAKDEVIGLLNFLATTKDYEKEDLWLAERVGFQIAGAVANAQLHMECKRVQNSLRLERDNAEKISQNIGAGLFIILKDYRVFWTNEILKEKFGKIVGEKCHAVFQNKLEICPQCGIREIFEQKKEKAVFEYTAMDADGQSAWFEVIATPIKNDQGEAVAAMALLISITNRIKTEEDLRRAKEYADAANRAKSEFLANMSHEIRTPMNGVIGITALLQETALTLEQRDYTEAIHASANSLLRIINEILDFSKIEAGKIGLDLIDFDLRATLENLGEMLAPLAQAKGLEYVYLIEPDVPVFLKGDPGRLRQILTNLIDNAIKFTASGEVAVRVSLREVKGNRLTLHVSVCDTGIGIPPEKVDILFRPFTQLDATISRKFGGTGLGLSISKRLVELMGGTIGVKSAPGKGSQFWFTAGLEKQPGEQKSARESAENLQNQRILVVSGNATRREALSVVLRSWRCFSDEAADPGSTLEKLHRAVADGTPFHLALLDDQLPGMDGEALGRRIKENETLQRIHLVMFVPLIKRVDKASLIGFSACLPQPVKQTQLYNCLARVLTQDPMIPDSGTLNPSEGIAIRNARHHNLRILVAEDNEINQKFVLKILENQGYRADAVSNGREAVHLLKTAPFDLVLMDLQMPEMDGLEATAHIRQWEKEIGGHIPILAMTAHALQGDRERFLQCGIDDYIPKPIPPKGLVEFIERALDRNESAPTNGSTSKMLVIDGVFDQREFLNRVNGDKKTLREIIDLFLRYMPLQMERLKSALAERNDSLVKRIAHDIKGSAANLCAEPLRFAAEQISEAPDTQDLSMLEAEIEQLEREWYRLESILLRT